MVWTMRPIRPIHAAVGPEVGRDRFAGLPVPAGPARWLTAGAAALAVVAMAAPHVFPVESAEALRATVIAAPPPQLPGGPALAANVRAAAAYAGEHGWMTGIAVVDTTTGEVVTGGNTNGFFPAESTAKVFVAARLLAGGAMTGDTQAKANAMIARSDDAAGGELYLAAGGDDLMAWASERYAIPGLGAPPTNGALTWGSTQVSPQGMARFLAAAKADPTVGPWLLAAMARTEDVAADGTDQVFGLKAVDRTAPVKQGWGGDVPGGDAELAPSVGFVGEGRYAVAIYTMHIPAAPADQARAMTTAQARILFGLSPTP